MDEVRGHSDCHRWEDYLDIFGDLKDAHTVFDESEVHANCMVSIEVFNKFTMIILGESNPILVSRGTSAPIATRLVTTLPEKLTIRFAYTLEEADQKTKALRASAINVSVRDDLSSYDAPYCALRMSGRSCTTKFKDNSRCIGLGCDDQQTIVMIRIWHCLATPRRHFRRFIS
ncbi:hypothetical protein Tco_0841358 [Tanacetum coccineum]|uniref:Uncharacterized protein n=1 Tax=Tanacetum coccineum TaxID=301880 RepID=A0ABQ5AX62_9ASTR